MTITDKQATLTALRAAAIAAMAPYPQYLRHFDAYRLVRVKRDVRTKMGLAFIKGAIATAREATVVRGEVILAAGVAAWSGRNTCDTYLSTADVEWVA